MSRLFQLASIIVLIIFLLLAAWVLVHFVAVLGIFLAVAFLFMALSFWKRLLPEFCLPWLPENFLAALKTSFLIIALTVVSIFIVFVESKVLNYFGFPPTPKTVSFIIPAKGQYRLGEIFPLNIEITGVKIPINAVQADLGFDASKLNVVDILTNGSFANIFIQKEIDNESGYARLTGGLPNPGYLSDHGLFGRVFFEAKNPGVVQVEYLPTSMVLANDGRGTNVLKDLSSVSYLILPERLTPQELEMQNKLFSGSTSAVLGESSQNPQMIFYNDRQVLGLSTPSAMFQPKAGNQNSLLDFLANALSKIDQFILSLFRL